MSISPVERAATQRIGSVEFVAPNEIKIVLDLEAPDGIAANAGILPRTFPRINGYVLISTEAGYLVAQVEWIAVERSPFPKRKGFQDFGLVDLPFPLRKMRANPLGVLQSLNKQNTGESLFEFKRGVQSFPSVGEPVLIPSDNQLRAIIESGENRHVKIGTSPLAANADVKIDPDRLFGRHLAILGNTGSGKSCSVAGLIQWCLDEAGKNCKEGQSPNARFIILDPNGEYSRVFNSESRQKARVFQVGADDFSLKVPIWFWNSAEWCSIMQASAKAQAPLLRRALRSMRNEEFELNTDLNVQIRGFLSTIITTIKHEQSTGSPWGSFPKPKSFFEKICRWLESIEDFKSRLDASNTYLDALIVSLTQYKERRSGMHPTYDSNNMEIKSIKSKMLDAFALFGGTEQDLLPKHEDIPVKFLSDVFVNLLKALAQETGNEQYLDFLITRIRTMLSDIHMKEIIGDQADINLEDWLAQYIGSDKDDTDITVIDLSLVPSEIINIVTAVIARMVFEALQRYRKLDKDRKTLPTVLVAEEAHTFIKRYKEGIEDKNAAVICTQVFERIAREGRKFGLGLLLASQRPSELSPTVLSQCNSFLLHRISNDKDQELVNRLVPDNLRGLLRELPSLPSQYAILLGWAAELPVLVRMNELKKEEQPYSNDPEFWKIWTNQEERSVNWKPIVEDWQMKNNIEYDNNE